MNKEIYLNFEEYNGVVKELREIGLKDLLSLFEKIKVSKDDWVVWKKNNVRVITKEEFGVDRNPSRFKKIRWKIEDVIKAIALLFLLILVMLIIFPLEYLKKVIKQREGYW